MAITTWKAAESILVAPDSGLQTSDTSPIDVDGSTHKRKHQSPTPLEEAGASNTTPSPVVDGDDAKRRKTKVNGHTDDETASSGGRSNNQKQDGNTARSRSHSSSRSRSSCSSSRSTSSSSSSRSSHSRSTSSRSRSSTSSRSVSSSSRSWSTRSSSTRSSRSTRSRSRSRSRSRPRQRSTDRNSPRFDTRRSRRHSHAESRRSDDIGGNGNGNGNADAEANLESRAEVQQHLESGSNHCASTPTSQSLNGLDGMGAHALQNGPYQSVTDASHMWNGPSTSAPMPLGPGQQSFVLATPNSFFNLVPHASVGFGAPPGSGVVSQVNIGQLNGHGVNVNQVAIHGLPFNQFTMSNGLNSQDMLCHEQTRPEAAWQPHIGRFALEQHAVANGEQFGVPRGPTNAPMQGPLAFSLLQAVTRTDGAIRLVNLGMGGHVLQFANNMCVPLTVGSALPVTATGMMQPVRAVLHNGTIAPLQTSLVVNGAFPQQAQVHMTSGQANAHQIFAPVQHGATIDAANSFPLSESAAGSDSQLLVLPNGHVVRVVRPAMR